MLELHLDDEYVDLVKRNSFGMFASTRLKQFHGVDYEFLGGISVDDFCP